MTECNSCGSFVSGDYARVFGDNDGVVHDCRHCPTSRGGDADEDSGGNDDRVVLLSEVRGSDADMSSGRTSSRRDPPSGREGSVPRQSSRGQSAQQGSAERDADEGTPTGRDGLGLNFASIRSVLTNGRG